MAVENIFREKTTSIPSISVWMYNAARNCTEPRVDGAAHEVLFVLEMYSELMLALASLIRALQGPLPSTLPPAHGSCSPGFTSSSTGALTRHSVRRGMRTEANVTTLSRLAHCSITPEFRTACKQLAQFLPRSKQSGF